MFYSFFVIGEDIKKLISMLQPVFNEEFLLLKIHIVLTVLEAVCFVFFWSVLFYSRLSFICVS